MNTYNALTWMTHTPFVCPPMGELTYLTQASPTTINVSTLDQASISSTLPRANNLGKQTNICENQYIWQLHTSPNLWPVHNYSVICQQSCRHTTYRCQFGSLLSHETAMELALFQNYCSYKCHFQSYRTHQNNPTASLGNISSFFPGTRKTGQPQSENSHR